MWKVNPKLMCRHHLLGEHLETHMFASSIKAKKNLSGYIKKNLIEMHNLKKRHDLLVEEMIRRNYNHKTPMKEQNLNRIGYIDPDESYKLLYDRCPNCRKLMDEQNKSERRS
jgi:hypothetical protein